MTDKDDLMKSLDELCKSFSNYIIVKSHYDYMTNVFFENLIHWLRLEATPDEEAAIVVTKLWYDFPNFRSKIKEAYYYDACRTINIPVTTKQIYCAICGEDVKIDINARDEHGDLVVPEICEKCARVTQKLEKPWNDYDQLDLIQFVLDKRKLIEMPYPQYLQTEHWQNLREQTFGIHGKSCQLCNSTENLNVHHRGYENRGFESPASDLTVLCKKCHAKFHGKG